MSNSSKTDDIFDKRQDMIVDFVFDEKVAHVFPDMIRRSVPGYDVIIPLLGIIAEKFVTPATNIYDLGCSLGAASLSMRRRIQQDDCRIIAVDNAEAMVEQCRHNIHMDEQGHTPVEVICDDIRNIDIQMARLIEELATGRGEVVSELRSEIRVLSRTMAAIAERSKK